MKLPINTGRVSRQQVVQRTSRSFNLGITNHNTTIKDRRPWGTLYNIDSDDFNPQELFKHPQLVWLYRRFVYRPCVNRYCTNPAERNEESERFIASAIVALYHLTDAFPVTGSKYPDAVKENIGARIRRFVLELEKQFRNSLLPEERNFYSEYHPLLRVAFRICRRCAVGKDVSLSNRDKFYMGLRARTNNGRQSIQCATTYSLVRPNRRGKSFGLNFSAISVQIPRRDTAEVLAI